MDRQILFATCRAFEYIALINFGVLLVSYVVLGGDAWAGRVVDGRYFVANHGHLHEVSSQAFMCSKLLVESMFVTGLAGFVASVVRSFLPRLGSA